MPLYQVEIRWPVKPFESCYIEVEASNRMKARCAAVTRAAEEYPEREFAAAVGVRIARSMASKIKAAA
jgi:hypothetical protein